MQLLKVFEVDFIEGGPAEIFDTAEGLVQPRLTVLEVVNDFTFLFHLESVIFCRFLNYVAQILHLLFIERVCTSSLLQYVVKVPPKFFTNLHLSLKHHLEICWDTNLVF